MLQHSRLSYLTGPDQQKAAIVLTDFQYFLFQGSLDICHRDPPDPSNMRYYLIIDDFFVFIKCFLSIVTEINFVRLVIPSQSADWRGNPILRLARKSVRSPHQSADWFAMTQWATFRKLDFRGIRLPNHNKTIIYQANKNNKPLAYRISGKVLSIYYSIFVRCCPKNVNTDSEPWGRFFWPGINGNTWYRNRQRMPVDNCYHI